MLTRRQLLLAGCVATGGVAVAVLLRREWGPMASIHPVVARIDAIRSLDDSDELVALGAARDAFFAHPDAAGHLGVWFRLFERFPEDDGYESLWSILHRIERVAGYEPLAVASVGSRPSRFPVYMVERLVDGGWREVVGVDLLGLLGQVAANAGCPESVRKDASYFLAGRAGRAEPGAAADGGGG